MAYEHIKRAALKLSALLKKAFGEFEKGLNAQLKVGLEKKNSIRIINITRGKLICKDTYFHLLGVGAVG
jgi:hypothetical protein